MTSNNASGARLAAVAVEAVSPRRRGRRPRHTQQARRGTWWRLLLAIAVTAVLCFPFYWMVVVAFGPDGEVFQPELRLWPSEWTLEHFEAIFERYSVLAWFGNSLVIAVIVTALTTTVNLLAGYAFAKLRFRGRDAIFLLTLATMMIPVQAIMVAQFNIITRLGVYGTYWGVILPGAAAAFGIFLARQFFLSLPDEILEAAKIDGAGQVRIFLQVVLPLCKPLIVVLVLLTLLGSWNDFVWPLIALKDPALYTLPIGILYLKGQTVPDYNGIMALSFISIVPMVLIFLLFQRYFVQGFARSGIK